MSCIRLHIITLAGDGCGGVAVDGSGGSVDST